MTPTKIVNGVTNAVQESTPQGKKLREAINWNGKFVGVITSIVSFVDYVVANVPKPCLTALKLVKTSINTFFAFDDVLQSGIILHKLRTSMNKVNKAETQEEKAAALIQTIEKLETMDPGSISKRLGYDKEANLGERLEEMKTKLQNEETQEEGLQEAEKMMKILKTRSIVMVGLGTVGTVASISNIVGIILALTPKAPIGYSFLAAGIAGELAANGAKYFLLNPNPFDGETKCRLFKIGDTIAGGFKFLGKKIENRVQAILPKKAQPAAAGA